MNKQKQAIWFSRHQPTAEQVADAARMGYAITLTAEAMALASVSIETDEQVAEVTEYFRSGDDMVDVAAVFGVFAAPIQSRIFAAKRECAEAVKVFSAWNIARTPEGGKPTFQHKCWCQVGWI